MEESGFRYILKGIKGRLILSFGLVILGFVLFLGFLVAGNANLSDRTQRIQSINLPINHSIDRVEADMHALYFKLQTATLNHDTIGNLNALDAAIVTSTNELVSERSTFSPVTQIIIDSARRSAVQLQRKASQINEWILANYVSENTDSAFVASLPEREADEFAPMMRTTQASARRFFIHTQHIRDESESLMAADIATVHTTVVASPQFIVGVGLVLVLLIGIAVYWFYTTFDKALRAPIDSLQHLVRGEAAEYTAPPGNEFGAIIDSTNTLSNNIQLASTFAQSIGEGNVNHAFSPLSEHDLLGNSLVQMRDKLKAINESDKRRNWVTEGLALFADIMRRSDDYMALSNSILLELVKYTKATQGGLYITQEVEYNEVLQLTACYAYERKKYLEKTIDPGEGLVGQCYLEARTIYIKEVPEDYVFITSGLGGANPTALLLVPLKVNEVTEGVIELASFKAFEPHEIEFVERLAEIIASTISNAKANDRTKQLLQESQQQSEEMRAQEEEMRQNMEEMQATQEQMQRQTEDMRKMQSNLEMERSMFQVLMEYLPDRITFKDKRSQVVRINQAKADYFNIRPEEMVGKTDLEYLSAEHAEEIGREEQAIMESGIAVVDTESRAVADNGDVLWSSTSRIPIVNERKEAAGIFSITKDITRLKIAEASIQDRERIIDQLLENVPVFRYQIDRDGIVRHMWKSHSLEGVDLGVFEFKPVKECMPEVYDMLVQDDLNDTDLIGKSVIDVNEEKEIFKHYLFKDSTYDNVYLGFALKQ